jgi:hypothetical protein
MLTRTIRRPISFTLLAVLMAVLTPNAIAQQQDLSPAERCIARVGHIAHNTVRFNRHVADDTVQAIRALADEGAPDMVIIATARIAKETINRKSYGSSQHIRAIVERCIEELREHDAPPPVIHSVIAAGEAARAAIAESADRAKGRINHAVRVAIEE